MLGDAKEAERPHGDDQDRHQAEQQTGGDVFEADHGPVSSCQPIWPMARPLTPRTRKWSRAKGVEAGGCWGIFFKWLAVVLIAIPLHRFQLAHFAADPRLIYPCFDEQQGLIALESFWTEVPVRVFNQLIVIAVVLFELFPEIAMEEPGIATDDPSHLLRVVIEAVELGLVVSDQALMSSNPDSLNGKVFI